MSPVAAASGRILVVDDEPANVRLLERLLRRAGHEEVRGTSDPREVLRLLDEFRPDVILLDLHMPHLDGYELLGQLRQRITPETFLPIVVLTADATQGAKRRALDLGARDVLTKPFDSTEVLLRVANLLETRRLYQRLHGRLEAVIQGAPVIVFATDRDGIFTLVEGAGLAALGVEPGAAVGRSILELESDVPDPPSLFRGALEGATGEIVARLGGIALLVRYGPLRGPGGRIEGVIGVATNITERQQAEQALREVNARLEAILQAAPLPMITVDADGIVSTWNPAAERVFGWSREEIVGSAAPIIASTDPEDDRQPRQLAGRPWGNGTIVGLEAAGIRRDGSLVALRVSTANLDDGSAVPAGAIVIAEDVTGEKRSVIERARLAAAVEQAPESIVITDRSGVIAYVNPAFERVSGYSSSEVVGEPSSLLLDQPDSAAARSMWATLKSGGIWSGDLVSRRKDGTPYTEEAVVSPIRDASGQIVEYLSVRRDVTRERALEADLQRQVRERATVLDALGRLKPGPTVEATAHSVVTEVARLPGVASAAIVVFPLDGGAIPVAVAGEAADLLVAGQAFGPEDASYLRGRAGQGPWSERLSAERDLIPGVGRVRPGTTASAVFAPLLVDGEVVGCLVARLSASTDWVDPGRLLPAALEFAAVASALLAPGLTEGREHAGARARVAATIADQEFATVFQPIVDLRTREAMGFEALTRFADGTPPDRWFADAVATGMGLDLEMATLRASVAAARLLPPGRWLSLNVSPALILEREFIGWLLAAAERPVVLEITEHSSVSDYRAVREAMSSFDLPVQLAVDDAGAGFSSLRHILELRPEIVKLDIDLVRGIATDPARQALVAGMRHFARTTGARLVAEGVETETQLVTLRELEVDLGQGYLLGRPVSVAVAAATAPVADAPTRAHHRAVPLPVALSSRSSAVAPARAVSH